MFGRELTSNIFSLRSKCSDVNWPVYRGHSQILESSVCVLSTFSQWFLQFGAKNNNSDLYSSMITSVLDTVLPSFEHQVRITSRKLSKLINDLSFKFFIYLFFGYIWTMVLILQTPHSSNCIICISNFYMSIT